MTNWETLSTVKPKYVDAKKINDEVPGIKRTPSKWQPLWMKLRKLDKGVGTKTH